VPPAKHPIPVIRVAALFISVLPSQSTQAALK